VTKYMATPIDHERTFAEDEIIVSKTDRKGWITYANAVFMKVALYDENELLAQPHSIVRHPDMPRCVFKLLWDRIESGKEIFAYVKNLAKDGSYYWVFAHVTPTFDADGGITGYHSNRRKPDREQLGAVEPLYRQLLAEEARHEDRKQGLQSSCDLLSKLLEARGVDYDEFVFSI
jgi:PAS domain S-box-containing protein